MCYTDGEGRKWKKVVRKERKIAIGEQVFVVLFFLGPLRKATVENCSHLTSLAIAIACF